MPLTWLQIEDMKRKLRNKSRLRIKGLYDRLDGKGMITVAHKDEGCITKERTVEQQSRQEIDLRPDPLFPDPLKDKKKCSECEIHLYACNFSPDRRNLDGLQGICKTCRAKMAKANYKPEKRKGRHKRLK